MKESFMKHRIVILLPLLFSMLFGVDASKDIEFQTTTTQEIQFDADTFQKNISLKKEMSETFKQARRGNGIPKPDIEPTRVSNKKTTPTSEKVSPKKLTEKKSFKESVNIETKKDKQAKKEAFLEKRDLAKQKRDELMAKAKASRTKMMADKNAIKYKIHKSNISTFSPPRNRNSRNGGVEFEFYSVADLYDAYGEVLSSVGAGCDGCDGNLGMMDDDGWVSTTSEAEFYEWADEFEFQSFYFQFIDENESGVYDEGEVYAVSCENGNASTVTSTTDFIDPDNVNIQLSLSNTGWEGTGGGDNGGIYVGPHVSVQPAGFNTPDGDGYFVRNYYGTSTSKYAIAKADDNSTIQSADRGNIVFTADWAANTDLGARFVALVDGVWYGSDQFGMDADDHGDMNQTQVMDWEVDLSVNADADNWYVSLAGAPSGYDWRDGNQWDPNPAADGGGLPAGDITQFGIAWLHTGNGDYGAVDNFRVTNDGNESNMTVAYDGSVYNLDFEEFWEQAYDFDWDNDNEMPTTGVLFGTVMDDSENSISNANLHIWNNNGTGQDFHFEADDIGYFSEEVEPGEYHVEAYPDGYINQSMIVVVNEGDLIEVFFNLEEENTNDGPFVEGIVRDFDGNPIAGAYVHANSDVGWYYDVQTNDEGYYHIDLDTTVIHFMDVSANEYWEDITMVEIGENGTQHDFALGLESETAFLEIWAGTTEWVSVPFAELESPQSPQGISRTDYEGWDYITVYPSQGFADIYGLSEEYGYAELHIEDIEAGNTYARAIYFEDDTSGGGEEDFTFIGEFEGHEYYLSEYESNWNDAFDTLVQYDEAYLVSITSEEENNFLTDAIMLITSDPSFTGGFYSESFGQWNWSNGEEWGYENWAEGQPDGDGIGDVLVFNDDGIGPGEWDDWSGSASLRFIVEVEDDSTGEDGSFIEGIVSDFDGRPIPGAIVDVYGQAGNWVTEADEVGYYHIDTDTPAGMVEVYVHDINEEYWPDYTNVNAYDYSSQFDFSLGKVEESSLIMVSVMTSNGDSVYFAEVNSPQSPQEMSYTGWEGIDLITVNPSDGFADIFGTSEEYGEAHIQVDSLETGMDYFVELIFGDDTTGGDNGWIEGHVFDQDGYPIMDVAIEGWNNENWFSTFTDINGYFGIEIMAGYYEMEAHTDGYFSDYNYVEVNPNEYTYVEFWLESENNMSMVYGHVMDDEENPISFAFVNASYLYDEWESDGSLTDENGYYEFYLEAGDYRISAGAEGFWVSAHDSVYVGNDSLWLDFNLSAIEQFDGGWSGNVNLNGNIEPGMIFLGIMSEDYQVIRLLDEPGFQNVPLVNGTYHVFAGADGYQEVFMPNAIQIENNEVNFDIHLVEEGLVLPPSIQFAGDVPNDQGRQMRLVWNAGLPGEWEYFEFFSIWRQVNGAPHTLWDFVETVPWHGMEPYSAVVPTLGDSTDMGIYWSTFRVTGHTVNPMVFFDSEPISGYSIDNIHPGAPNGVQVFSQDDGVTLTWDHSQDEDFGYHKVYRYDLNSEEPAIEFTTADTFFVDNVSNSNLEYWVTAVDLNGNESDPSNVVTITLAIEDGLSVPIEFALQQNYPNPFNPSTQIQYALPTDANVTIAIYDLVGRQIRTLVNEQVNAGFHSTLWNATNDMGSPVSAGVYIYTITANDFRDVKKMILLK